MAIFITGDTHGDFSRLLPAAFHEQRDLTKEDYLIICGDFGGVWDGGDAEQQWLDWLETRSFTLSGPALYTPAFDNSEFRGRIAALK